MFYVSIKFLLNWEIDERLPRYSASVFGGLSTVTEYSSWYLSKAAGVNALSSTMTILAHWRIHSFSAFWFMFE